MFEVIWLPSNNAKQCQCVSVVFGSYNVLLFPASMALGEHLIPPHVGFKVLSECLFSGAIVRRDCIVIFGFFMPSLEISPQNLAKTKMESGELAVGMVVRLMRGVEVVAIAKSAGFDCLYVDLEHCSFSLETVSQICIAATALGVTPMVRVAGKDKAEIGRTLETGAQGIIVPHIENRAEAEQVVEAARFSPLGDRSLLAASPHTLFRGGPAGEVMRRLNESTLVTGMIESVTAVENAEEIASVEGIDMLLVGTNDLCNSLGVPGQLDHPKVREAYAHVAAACRAKGKHLGVGGLNSRPDIAREMIAIGGRYVSAGSDTGFLMSAATAAANAFR
ncbi:MULTISPECIES: aldolase/citrate lyase family protein [unclassified Mesorhizobium]|uniref:HpcH/HpaI aldolase family protein n=1 Tax=unclassified Mesorhizobium TaxID=325217 RepID=UPI001FE0AAD5|nr:MULTISPECIES: aldolase/citrate lyase family protein [unclassified Mesorhizobium]